MTMWLLTICWLIVIIEIFIPRIGSFKIYPKIVQLFFIVAFLYMISSPMFSDAHDAWKFTWFYLCSLGVIVNLYFLLRGINLDARKSTQRLHMLGCAIFLIGIAFSPWKP